MPEENEGAENKNELQLPKAFEDSMSSLAKTMEAIGKGVQDLDISVKEMQKGQGEDGDGGGDDNDGDDYSSSLENLSRKDFMDVIVKKIGKVVGDQVKGVTDRQDRSEEDTQRTSMERSIKKAGDNHKDFWDWREEMGQQVKRNPNLTPEDAYILARSSNSKKVKELDKKYSEGDEGKGESKMAPFFGGLTPTSGGKTEDTKDLDGGEAAEAAWGRTFGGAEKAGESGE